MELFFREIDCRPSKADTKPVIIFIHGLYSSSSNWYTLARSVARESESRLFLLDLPNHGHSPKVNAFGYFCYADFVAEWIRERNFDNGVIVIGHSFAARMAMIVAARLGQPMLRGYVMIDMSPIITRRTDRMISMWHAMLLGRMISAKDEGVTDIAAFLEQHKIERTFAESMRMPYRQMNLQPILDNVMSLTNEIQAGQTDEFWALIKDIPVLFVRGGKSPYMPLESIGKLPERFNNYSVVTIDNAAHDVHHTHGRELKEAILNFLHN